MPRSCHYGELAAVGVPGFAARLLPLRDLVGDRFRRARRADADHRHRVEAEPERVRDPGDLQDVLVAETAVAGTDRRLGDADLGRDAAERLTAVLLQRLDDLAIDRVELSPRSDRAASLLGSQCEAIRTNPRALGQSLTVRLLR